METNFMGKIEAKQNACRMGMAYFTALGLGVGLSGCAAAVIGAGAGGAGMAAYTERGAKADLKGNVASLRSHTEEAFREKGLKVYEKTTRNGGTEEVIRGKSGNFDVTATLAASGENLVHVDIVAREGDFKWNKDYAKDLLAKVIAETD
jgi:hypothetical protein